MKLLLTFLALLASSAGAITLPEALAQAATRSGVIEAELALGEARRTQERTLADPLALRLDRAQARQGVELAEAKMQQARYEAFAEIAAGYTQVLDAEMQLALAEAAKGLSQQALDIARIRLQRGSATRLEVQDAETSLLDSDKNVVAAREGLALARTNLAGLTGLELDTLEPFDETLLAVELADSQLFLQNLASHPTLLQVQHGVELAGIAVDLLDPSYASRAQIENAQLQLEQAESGAREAKRGLELQAQSLYNSTSTAAESYRIALAALANARQREQLEAQRLEAGLIAEISYRQTQLATLQEELAATQSRHRLLLALLDLQAGTMTPLEGLYGF